MVHLTDIKDRAKALYYKHMELDRDLYHFMWKQCSQDYREAWMLIAAADLGVDYGKD